MACISPLSPKENLEVPSRLYIPMLTRRSERPVYQQKDHDSTYHRQQAILPVTTANQNLPIAKRYGSMFPGGSKAQLFREVFA